jgi:hypothetical protein
MMPQPPFVFEHLARVTPLGMRFWDQVSRATVSDGLVVTAYPVNNPARKVSAIANRSGIFVVQGLPGLREVEYGKGDTDFWEKFPPHVSPPNSAFVVEVVDERGRFQPFQFTVDVPVKGLLTWESESADSPPKAFPYLPLYSTPARSVPSGMAVLRADLKDGATNKLAAWAVLEARLEGQPPVQGIAGKDGRIVLVFPYPEPVSGPLGSPPGFPPSGERKPLLEQKWAVTLQAWYSASASIPDRPDLSTVFTQQPATLYATVLPEKTLTSVTLEFGKDLIVKTELQSELFIQSVTSP